MMTGSCLSIVVAVAALATPDEIDSGDAAKIQGRWTVGFLGEAGVCLPPNVAKQITMEFRGPSISMSSPMWGVSKGTVHLDESRSPKEIDMVWGDEKKIVRGIYELDGDKLTICTGAKGDVRPTKIACDSASGNGVTVLSRKAP